MRYVIIRDDDTNALTPVDCLERLYRPFLNRGLPVNLATIPNVATNTTMPDGKPEGFLRYKNGARQKVLPIGSNRNLVRYLLENPGYNIVQHGFNHEYLEFEQRSAEEIARRLDEGRRLLMEAGFPAPDTFVAPYDKLSRASLAAVASRFAVLSTGWFELRRLPFSWWPKYALRKLKAAPHWQVGQTLLLTHPGCILSCFRNYDTILNEIRSQVSRRLVTVLVTHWWEYFRDAEPDEKLIAVLHLTAEYLASDPGIKVISFSELSEGALDSGKKGSEVGSRERARTSNPPVNSRLLYH
jgi:hypothetical protein